MLRADEWNSHGVSYIPSCSYFTEHFEVQALDKAVIKPSCLYTHLDGICNIWPHSSHELNNIENMHPIIQFINQQESAGHLPFLDIDIYSSAGRSLGQGVCRKPTHKINTSRLPHTTIRARNSVPSQPT
jgi:hypothetical protein